MDAATFAIWNAAAMVLIILAHRRLLFSWSAVGVFTLSHIAILLIGVLAIPLFREYAAFRYATYDLGRLTDADLKLAIIINVWGVGLVLAFYHLTHIVFTGGEIRRRGPNLLSVDPRHATLGFRRNRLLLAAGALLLVALAHAVTRGASIIAGVQGAVAGSYGSLLEARSDIGADYWFVVTVFDVLPFLGVALRLAQRAENGQGLAAFTSVFNACTAGLLLFTFQKRPLLLFLSCLFLVELTTYRKQGRRGSVRLTLYGTIVFVMLMVLFQLQTQVAAGAEGVQDLLQRLGSLAAISATTLFSGQAIPSVLLIHYYPAIEPYYGFRTIRLFSKIFGFDLYRSTAVVWDYFNMADSFSLVERVEGTLSNPSLTDFYCAFGLVGWMFGAAALGIILNRVDAMLNRLRPDAARSLLAIFVFVSAFYLANASLANTLVGYGGLLFGLMWYSLRVPFRPRLKTAIATS